MIRVVIPPHLRTLSKTGSEIKLDIQGDVTQRSILDALEAEYPMLRGLIRDHTTKKRRDLVRFYVCNEDASHNAPDDPLPEEVVSGKEPFLIIGSIAGG